MKRCLFVTLLLVMAGCSQAESPVSAKQEEKKTAVLDGKALFQEKCVMCHGAIGMGTGLLARRIQPAELEQRDNLVAEYVIMFARNGIGNMPAIPRGEVSDPQLRAIAEYLSQPKQQ